MVGVERECTVVGSMVKWRMGCRVGRTARGTGGKGKALLFLMPEELGFLRYLKDSKVPFRGFCLRLSAM